MTKEEQELFNAYKEECEALWTLAQEIDVRFPETPGAFTGPPSERIRRQLVNIFEEIK